MRRRLLAGVLVVLGTVSMVGGVASAGEITGPANGKGHGPDAKSTPINPDGVPGNDDNVAASDCAFSGLNDEFILGDTSAPRVQTPAEAPPGVAGFACRGSGPA